MFLVIAARLSGIVATQQHGDVMKSNRLREAFEAPITLYSSIFAVGAAALMVPNGLVAIFGILFAGYGGAGIMMSAMTTTSYAAPKPKQEQRPDHKLER